MLEEIREVIKQRKGEKWLREEMKREKNTIVTEMQERRETVWEVGKEEEKKKRKEREKRGISNKRR